MENVVFTNMCLIYKEDKILVQERTKSDWPGITLPGGHVEKGENFFEAVKREILEETGLTLKSAKLCAVEEYTPISGEDRHIIFLYKSNDFSGVVREHIENEDRVFWIDRSKLFELNLSEDLDVMYEAITNEDISELIYYKEDGIVKKKFV